MGWSHIDSYWETSVLVCLAMPALGFSPPHILHCSYLFTLITTDFYDCDTGRFMSLSLMDSRKLLIDASVSPSVNPIYWTVMPDLWLWVLMGVIIGVWRHWLVSLNLVNMWLLTPCALLSGAIFLRIDHVVFIPDFWSWIVHLYGS